MRFLWTQADLLCSLQEVCLRCIAEGLETFMVLLKHLEKEHPNNSNFSEVRDGSRGLISRIKEEVSLLSGLCMLLRLISFPKNCSYVTCLTITPHSVLSSNLPHCFLLFRWRNLAKSKCRPASKRRSCCSSALTTMMLSTNGWPHSPFCSSSTTSFVMAKGQFVR